jgi:AraC-like DNA-binding protein
VNVSEKGVMPGSNIYFHTPGEEDLKLFLYPICCGNYFCDGNYFVNRDNYDSFLVLFVKHGSGFVYLGDRRAELFENDVILLDCYRPHRYGTTSEWEILWVHFDGVMARGYFESAAQGANCIVSTPQDPQNIHRNIQKIYTQFHETYAINDTLNNKYMVNVLTEFLLHRSAVVSERAAGITEDLLAYITENIRLPLTLEDLAERASLSVYYFTRLFKKETGYTPHKYVLTARINAAKFYLKSSSLSIKEIAANCGFSSESSFCIAFRRILGTTPLAYRNKQS